MPLFVGTFIYNLLLSIICGTVFGMISSVMLKHCTTIQSEPVFESALVLFMAYFSYVIAEIVGFSGVITVLI